MLDKNRSLKIALLQDQPGSNIREIYYSRLKDFAPDIIAMPEYFFVGPAYDNTASSFVIKDELLTQLKKWSSEFNCLLIGGTLVERLGKINFNRCYLLNKGDIIGHYDKIHLFRDEGHGQITPGNEYKVFAIGGLRIGLLICADVLYPDTFRNIRGLKPDLIFIPTTSPNRPDETIEAKFARDIQIFANGAVAADSIIFKVSASGSILKHKLQGRSLIASPGKILWRIDPENEDKPALILSELSGTKTNPILDISPT
jgi:predicted amidohydrolase